MRCAGEIGVFNKVTVMKAEIASNFTPHVSVLQRRDLFASLGGHSSISTTRLYDKRKLRTEDSPNWNENQEEKRKRHAGHLLTEQWRKDRRCHSRDAMTSMIFSTSGAPRDAYGEAVTADTNLQGG